MWLIRFRTHFVQINTIKRILFRIIRFFSFEEKIRIKRDIERFKETAKKAENGGCDRWRKKAVQFSQHTLTPEFNKLVKVLSIK